MPLDVRDNWTEDSFEDEYYLDFFLRWCMNILIYEIPVEAEEDLLARMLVAGQHIGVAPGVMMNIIHRYNVCVEVVKDLNVN